MSSKETLYAAYRAHALRQWIVDLEVSESTPGLVLMKGHSPAHGTRHGFMLRDMPEVPSRVQILRGLKGITRVDEGFYTTLVYCEAARQNDVIQEIGARLADLGFITSAQWEARLAAEQPTTDPRPLRHIRIKPASMK